MQDFLTVVVEAIAIASAVYFVAGFVSLSIEHKPVALLPAVVEMPAEIPTQDEVDAVMEALTIAAAPLAVVESIEVDSPNWAAIAPVQLRKECQLRGIRWRNAHGENRHLKKAEMIEALQGCAAG